MTNSLAGRMIVNTRAVEQAGELDDLLRERGAKPISYPCIAIAPPDDPAKLDAALDDLLAGEFDWLVFTSANTVRSLAARGLRAPKAPSWRTAVVGPATRAAALRELGLTSDVLPEDYNATDLAAAIPLKPGDRVFLPQSVIAPPDLTDALTAKGAKVQALTAYQTTVGSGGVRMAEFLALGLVDGVVFASSSAVDGFVSRLACEGLGLSVLGSIPVVCIGQSTADRALQRGFPSPVVSGKQTLAGIVDALESVFTHQPVSKGMIS